MPWELGTGRTDVVNVADMVGVILLENTLGLTLAEDAVEPPVDDNTPELAVDTGALNPAVDDPLDLELVVLTG